jgi:hypothetical protein
MDFGRVDIFGDDEGDSDRPLPKRPTPSGSSSRHSPLSGASSESLGASLNPSTGTYDYTPQELDFLANVRRLEKAGEVPSGTSFRLQMNPAELMRSMSEVQNKAVGQKIEEVATKEVAAAISKAQGPGITIKGKRFNLRKPPEWAVTIVTWVTIGTVAWGLFKLGRGMLARRGRGGGGGRRRFLPFGGKRRRKSKS